MPAISTSKELSWVQATSDAVSDGFATYLRLLQSPDAQLRASAAHVLCRCQSHTLEVVPAMKQHLFAEKTALVHASLLLSLGSLLEKDEKTMFFFASVWQSAEDPLVQIAAAMGCAFAMKEQTDQKTPEVLVKGYELPSTVKEQFGELPFADVDFDASVSIAWRAIGLSISSLILPTLTRAIRRSNSWSCLKLVPKVLYLAFGDQKLPRTTTVTDLSDLQRDVLTAIYETEELWTFGNMAFAVGKVFEPPFNLVSRPHGIRKDASFSSDSFYGKLAFGRRRAIAIFNAFSARASSQQSDMDHPTAALEDKSIAVRLLQASGWTMFSPANLVTPTQAVTVERRTTSTGEGLVPLACSTTSVGVVGKA